MEPSVTLSSGHYFGDRTQEIHHSLFMACLTAHTPFWEADRHTHANPYFSLLLKGQYLEKGALPDRTIQSGQLLYRASGYTHANTFLTEATCFNVELKPELVAALPLPTLPYLVVQTGVLAFYQLLVPFLSAPSSPDLTEPLLYFMERMQPKTTPLKAPWLATLKHILDTENEVFHTLQALAGRVFIHPVYLARAFRQAEGITVGQYQMQRKMERAVVLLVNKKLPIYRVAAALGFSDASHFTKAFRASFHVSPKQFYKRLKG